MGIRLYTLGFNYISETAAKKDVELCSEDGEYIIDMILFTI